jgi:hypothetical protein
MPDTILSTRTFAFTSLIIQQNSHFRRLPEQGSDFPLGTAEGKML